MSISSIVKLRACDRCRFVFDMTEYNGNRNCPLCQFSTHSATIIHGERAKEFLKTQEPMQKRLLAVKREEAILEFERNVEHAATIKRNIVKQKLNIAGDDVPSNKGISLQDLAVMRGFTPSTIKPVSPVFYTSLPETEHNLTKHEYGISLDPPKKTALSSSTLWGAVQKIWENKGKEEDEK